MRELESAAAQQTLYRAARQGSVVAVRPGVFAPTAEWEAMQVEDRHRVRIRETVTALSGAVVSHESAALLHGIPLLGQIGDLVHVLRPRSTGFTRSAQVVYHTAASRPTVVRVDGVAVTSVARTVVDLARTGGFARGLVAADYVLAKGLATREELWAEVHAAARHSGVGVARRVVERADALSESVGESLTRARLYLLHAPIPELQVSVTVSGQFYRLDFLWRDLGIVGEFDGAIKYGVTAAEAASAVRREKLREDELRRVFRTVIRFTWDDVLRIDPFEAELRRVGILTGPSVRDSRFL